MNLTDAVKFTENRLEFSVENTVGVIEPWGTDSLRVRVSPAGSQPLSDWALNIPQPACRCEGGVAEDEAFLRNGKIVARMTNTRFQSCMLGFYRITQRGEECILKEKDYIVIANLAPARRFKAIGDGLYEAEIHFEADADEQFYGLGQNELNTVGLKGNVIDLYQRHIKAPIPFVLSTKGYGFLWNNPSLGRVEFCGDRTRWVSYGTRQVDYYVTVGDDYAEIFRHYIDAVGHMPVFPYWASGFWQCKLRYKNQEELLEVAREFKKRDLPLSVIVIDYLHWKAIGDWRLDPDCWPDPEAMTDELSKMGVRVMVSPWLLVGRKSENYAYMKEHGLFTRAENGAAEELDFEGDLCGEYDPTNPEAADYLWSKWKKNYYDKGIHTFWLDPCDEMHLIPEYGDVRFALGSAKECHAWFVIAHQKNIYDGLCGCGEEGVVNICRNGWVGSWRYGGCTAPHDIESSFRHMRAYFRAGLNVMMSGQPLWGCDIGGFWTNPGSEDEFCETMIRWYQWGVFMPVFRTHGNRPNNEPWTVGGDSYPYIRAQILLREKLRPYLMEQMETASKTGLPPVRPLFFDYADDPMTYDETASMEELLFGPDLLAAPVMEYRCRERAVYLPRGAKWIDAATGDVHAGGQTLHCEAPLSRIPVFIRENAKNAEELQRLFADHLKAVSQLPG